MMQPYSSIDLSLLIRWKMLPIIINSEKEQDEMELPTMALTKLFSVKCWLGEWLAEVSPCAMTSAPTSDVVLVLLKAQEGQVVDVSDSPGLVNTKRGWVTEYAGGKLTPAPRERNLVISSSKEKKTSNLRWQEFKNRWKDMLGAKKAARKFYSCFTFWCPVRFCP